MKIAHFLLGRCNPDSANGVDKTIYYLSREQAKLGHQVTVFSLSSKTPIPIPGADIVCFPPEKNPFALPKNMLDWLSKFKPDVVHLHSAYVPQNSSLARFLRRQKIAYVVTPHGGLSKHVLKRHALLKHTYRVLFELPILNGAVFVHAVSEGEGIQEYGVKAPILYLPNGIDLSSIPQELDAEFLRRKYPSLKNKKVYLFLGRFDLELKGLDLLVYAVSQVVSSDYGLVLVGPDFKGGKRNVLNLVRELKLQDRIFISEPMYGKDKFNLLHSADVFVHTSRSEGIPFSVLEASAVGKPCLVTSAANPMNKITEYSAGWLTDTKANAISEALMLINQVPQETLNVMGKRARQMVEKEFCWQTIAEKLIAGYEKYAI